MTDDQRAKASRIAHRAGQGLCLGRDAGSIREGDGACVAQKADLGHFMPVAALGQRGHVADADRAFRSSSGDELQHFGRVDRGVGVGPGDDGGDPPRRSSQTGRAKAFAVPFPRLTNLDADVDDPRRKTLAAAVDDLGPLWGFVVSRHDDPILDRQAAGFVRSGLGVNQAGVQEVEDHAVPI